jgi:hypothetical protein
VVVEGREEEISRWVKHFPQRRLIASTRHVSNDILNVALFCRCLVGVDFESEKRIDTDIDRGDQWVVAGFAYGATEEGGQIAAHHLLAQVLFLSRHFATIKVVIDDAVADGLIESTYDKLAKTSRGSNTRLTKDCSRSGRLSDIETVNGFNGIDSLRS